MNDRNLLRLAAACAILAGALRIGTSFIPWTTLDFRLEATAFLIDVCLLFGLMGIYIANRDRVGITGLLGFIVATMGTALIVGPDQIAFGFSTYEVGVYIISLGLVLLSIASLISRAMVWAPLLWIASILSGASGAGFGFGPNAWLVAGVLFGAGFVIAGVNVWRKAG